MPMKMDEFLLKYYQQLNFNNMPAEVRVQFDSYAKAKDFRGNMKDWDKNLTDDDGENKPLPDAVEEFVDGNGNVNDVEWEKLFKAFQNAFRSMDANKKSFKDNKKANDFLKEYFGDGKLFTLFTSSQQVSRYIDQLSNVLAGAQKDAIYSSIQNSTSLFEDRAEYNDFLKDIADKKYNSDIKVRNKLIRVAGYLYNGLQNDSFNKNHALENELNSLNLMGITSGFDDTGLMDPQKLAYFKRNYNSLLKDLYSETKIREVFAANDNGKISKHLDEALAKTDYANKESKDYVPPKRTEELTLKQQISNWVSDTYEDYLKKYVTLRGDRQFFSPEAKLIVKAIDGAKIKPTDGLEKVLNESKKIKDNLIYKSPAATDAFEYFEKVMGELKSTMGKTFAGALKNGRQMRAVIEEMALHAVRNGKVKEAKVAMEVISVLKYGITTSRVMDAIKKEPMTVFSDKSLSWNKNKGVQFVTQAIDKGIKTAFMGVGYGVTMIGNKIRLSGRKFHGKSKRLSSARDALNAQNDAAHIAAQNERRDIEAQRNTIESNLEARRRTGPDEAALEADIANIETEIQLIENHERNLVSWYQNPANTTSPDYPAIEQYLTMGVVPVVRLTDTTLQDSVDAIEQMPAKQTELEIKNQQLDVFKDGTNTIEMLNNQIEKRDAQLESWDNDHKDQYQELMAHWDFLETGSHVKSFSLGSKSAKQKRLDSKVNAIDPATRTEMLDPDTGEVIKRSKREQILKDYYHKYGQEH